MKKARIPIEIHTVNLLLRCVRDCHIGTQEHLQALIEEWKDPDQKSLPKMDKKADQESKADFNPNLPVPVVTINLLETNTRSPEFKDQLQLMTETIVKLDIDSLKRSENRLQLLGGVNEVYEMIENYQLRPSIATMTTLLECLGNNSKISKDMEDQLILYAERKKSIKFDTDFYNILIKRRSCRGDTPGVKEALAEMQNKGLPANIMTFGVLALTCDSRKRGLQLMRDMNMAGIKMNIEIAETLINKACFIPDFEYLMQILENMSEKKLRPLPSTIEKIEMASQKTSKILLQLERKQNVSSMADFQSFSSCKSLQKTDVSVFEMDGFSSKYDEFKLFYKVWLKNNKIEFPQDYMKQFDFDLETKPLTKYYEFERMMKEKLREKREREELAELN